MEIARQGSFFVGGEQVRGEGEIDPTVGPASMGNNQSFWINQTYVQFQIPARARATPIVLWHGGGLTGKAFESTPDGRDGYQSILVKRGFPVYIIDQVGRGRANVPTFNGEFGSLDGTRVVPAETSRVGIDLAWMRDRLGPRPGTFFENSAFARGYERQYFQQMTFTIPGLTANQLADGVVALLDEIGPSVLVTHSASGAPGWRTAIRSRHVKAIVSYEPALSHFPTGQLPPLPPGPLAGEPVEIPDDEFARLTEFPIQLVYGDNIPLVETPQAWYLDWWRVNRYLQGEFVEAVNRAGGSASVLDLPAAGLVGNTHFPFSDLNNEDVASLLVEYLASNGID